MLNLVRNEMVATRGFAFESGFSVRNSLGPQLEPTYPFLNARRLTFALFRSLYKLLLPTPVLFPSLSLSLLLRVLGE